MKRIVYFLIVSVLAVSVAEGALVAHWTLDTDPNDLTGNHHGTFVGTPVSVAGEVDGAFDFASTEYLALDTAFDRPDVFTIAAWVKTTATGLKQIFGWSTPAFGVLFRINTGVLEYGEWDGVTYGNITAGSGLNDGQWHHVAVTFDNTATELYIDGVPANSGTVATNCGTIPMTAVSVGNLGDWDPATYSITGALDDVRMYDTVQTAVDIAVLAKVTLIPLLEDDAKDVPVNQVLSWMHNDPNITTLVGYDVYLDPNETLVDAGDASVKVSPSQAGTSYEPNDLAFGTPYFWRVDVIADFDYIPGTNPNTVDGITWKFTTVGSAPGITNFDSASTALSLLPVTLSADVSDIDDNISVVTWEVLDDDVSYPAGATATLTPTVPALDSPFTTTADFNTDTNGLYKIRLTVTDASSHIAEEIVQVFVYETACDLTLAFGLPVSDFDFNADCLVNLTDFALFAADWLDDSRATAAETYSWTPTYYPLINGLINSDFETGDLTGWWTTSANVAITDVAADVHAGSYAVEIPEGEGLNSFTLNEGYYNLPAGNHSIKFMYKGDLPEVAIDLKSSMGEDTAPTDGSEGALVNSTETGFEDYWVVENTTVASYTQYEVRFTVTTEGLGDFKIQSTTGGTGTTGNFDSFELVLNSH